MNFRFDFIWPILIWVFLLHVRNVHQVDLGIIGELVDNTVGSIVDTIIDSQGVVKTKYGLLKGSTMRSRNGREFNSFLGIRYAKPPTGNLRFANPQKPDPWTGIQFAIEDGPICLQKNYFLKGAPVSGQEDCLFLNVYTHKIASNNEPVKDKSPVMVFIHGGGWFSGSGSSENLGPEFFMDQDIVLVTLNYRLGVLGYFSTGDKAAVGNWGLKDQIFALRWVRNNIEAFGGDRKRVTLFGQGAGSASVFFHMINASLKGLFHRAIMQSGVGFASWSIPYRLNESLAIAVRQAQFVNCKVNINNNNQPNTKEIVQCLRQVDSMDLVQSGQRFKYFSVDPLTLYRPVIEESNQDDDEQVSEYIKKRKLNSISKAGIFFNGLDNRVPFMLGTVSNEGVIRTGPLFTNATETQEFNKRFVELLPKQIELDKVCLLCDIPEAPEAISRALKRLVANYLNNEEKLSEETFTGLTNIFSDFGFNYYSLVLANRFPKNNYFYYFDYRGDNSFSTVLTETSKDFGVVHGDDLIYLFNMPTLFPKLSPNDQYASEKMIQFWTNFAKYGDPTFNCTDCKDKWLTIDKRRKPSNGKKNFANAELAYYCMTNSTENKFEFSLQDIFLKDRMKVSNSIVGIDIYRRLYA